MFSDVLTVVIVLLMAILVIYPAVSAVKGALFKQRDRRHRRRQRTPIDDSEQVVTR